MSSGLSNALPRHPVRSAAFQAAMPASQPAYPLARCMPARRHAEELSYE